MSRSQPAAPIAPKHAGIEAFFSSLLGQLVTGIIDSYRQTISGVELHCDHPACVRVQLDPALVEEAVNNLMSNAISFATEHSVIDVAVSYNDGAAIITVCNQGPLVDGDIDALFGPFASTRSGPVGEHQGLGLYVVRLIAEQYGGSATIINLADLSGVVASLRFPVDPSAQPHATTQTN